MADDALDERPRLSRDQQLIELLRDRDHAHERRHQELLGEMRGLRESVIGLHQNAPTRSEIRAAIGALFLLLVVLLNLYSQARGEDPRVAAQATQQILQAAQSP